MRLIDADKLKETISKYEFTVPNKTYQHGGECVLNFYMPKIIDNAPTIEAEPVRHGEWVYGEYDIPHCSECGMHPKEISHYCSHCGAKMDGGGLDEK